MPLSGAAPVQCLEIVLKAGEGVRAVATMDTAPGSSGVRILVYAPGEAAPALQIELGNLDRVPITWRAEVSGAHHLVVRDAWSFARGVTQVPVSIWIEQVEPPALADARDAAVSADPRVGWLRQNAVEIRSIDPQDTDFSDLQSLRSSLEGVRLVLLTEADHRSGSDFLAKSRLVKFLHQELGFDVLAFDAPIYGMAVAWDHMRSGMAPREAFAQGAWGFWANSEQMRPLIEYVAEQAQGERPIELAGIDRQFLVGEASARFAQDLVTFLVDRDLSDPLALPGGSNMHILESLALRRYDVGGMPLPDSAAGAVFLDGLEQTIARAAALDDRGARFWTQVMRSTACYARFLVQEADPCDGSRQRAQNVIWLVNEYFLGHRIIVWTGVQAARMPELPAAGGSGPSMGYYLDEVLGTESYAIGLTSYRSAGGHIVTDQHQLPEFEELMSAAGFNQALLDLRRARAEASWAGEEFLARPILYGTLPAVWSDLLDALLFVREHHPSVSVR
jgi:erythromycin esterase